jgi:hypothetical protein
VGNDVYLYTGWTLKRTGDPELYFLLSVEAGVGWEL